MSERDRYDMVIVGAGISAAFTILNMFSGERAAKAADAPPVSVMVVEPNDELWTGAAYGRRAAINSLLIHSLNEHLAPELRDEFFTWLTENRDRWTSVMVEKGGVVAERWLERNRDWIEASDWGDMYLPRFVVGMFIRPKMDRAIAQAQAAGLANFTIVKGEVTDLQPLADGVSRLTLNVGGTEARTVLASTVVLALGTSAQAVIGGAAQAVRTSASYIADPYTPGLDETVDRVEQKVSAQHPGRLMIIGSNASALECIYCIANTPSIHSALKEVICISPSGALPVAVEKTARDDIQLKALEAVLKVQDITADALFKATEADHDDLLAQQIEPAIAHRVFARHVEAAQKLMTADEVRRFHGLYGQRFTKSLRRAGAEYCAAADELRGEGKLIVVKGRVSSLKTAPNETIEVTATHGANNETVYLGAFDVVIDCGGFQPLAQINDDSLLSKLFKSGLCEASASGLGVKVDEDFQISPGVFVMGPLLGGVFNDRLKTWHIENARRLYGAAQLLAPLVWDRILQMQSSDEKEALSA